MFKNPGSKLKSLAKFIFAILLIVPIILGLLLMTGMFGTQAGISGVLLGVLVICLGILIAWLSTIFLYTIGEIADDIEEIRGTLERLDYMQYLQEKNR